MQISLKQKIVGEPIGDTLFGKTVSIPFVGQTIIGIFNFLVFLSFLSFFFKPFSLRLCL